jgi:hypothetical protein
MGRYRDYSAFTHSQSASIVKEHKYSETRPASVLRWKCEEAPIQVGILEKGKEPG